MSKAATNGVLEYVDQQIDALRLHVPAAMDHFNATGIHQARVATRRLKAALELLAADDDALRPLARAGKKLRRFLGPLRDADVMIGHLDEYQVPQRLAGARDWLASVLQADRQALHVDGTGKKSAGKRLKPFDGWWALRRHYEGDTGLKARIAERLIAQADAFALKADRLTGLSTASIGAPIDVHELRIDGKALRYTFELAAAQGLRVPKRVFKSFKAMQEAMGAWHDYVVLADRTTACWSSREIALHDPKLAAEVLDLAKLFIKDAGVALTRFKSRWKRSGRGILRLIERFRLPSALEAPPAISESQTDPHPPETASPPDQGMP